MDGRGGCKETDGKMVNWGRGEDMSESGSEADAKVIQKRRLSAKVFRRLN